VSYVEAEYEMSERHACRLMGLGRSTHRYRARKAGRDAVLRVYRLYREEGLAMRVRQRRRIRWSGAVVKPAASQPNERWSMDFRERLRGRREGDSDVDHRGRLHAGMSGHRGRYLAEQTACTVAATNMLRRTPSW